MITVTIVNIEIPTKYCWDSFNW